MFTLCSTCRSLRVIRFWNSDVLKHRDSVCFTILHACGGEAKGPG